MPCNATELVHFMPCHRVVKSNGELGGFADDLSVKIKRLQKEGVLVKNGKIIDFKKISV
jgi:methylated-DNA-[protein]-cysteine S-methyltransferase